MFKIYAHIFKVSIFVLCLLQCFNTAVEGISILNNQPNKTHHVRRSSDIYYNKDRGPSYRSYQPVAIKHNKATYAREDYDITSYDTEYGGVVSNFTSSIYDDNPQLYPNPEYVAKSNQVNKMQQEVKATEPEVDLPDDSLADADLKERNSIDGATYVYGYSNNCPGVRQDWMILIFLTSGISGILLVAAIVWLMWSEYAKEFRLHSKIYPINMNLCCCLMACNLLYVQAITGVSMPSQCERVALLLHYTHITCVMWMVALAAAVAEYCVCDTLLPLKYNYLLAYGVPAVTVMFNYALSMEHYEIKHYCWMSIEKGMVMGFMVPAMILILINTGIVIIGLQSVNKKQAEMLTAKIQELVEHHVANWPKMEQTDENKNASLNNLEMYSPGNGNSRKNTDSSDTLDKEYGMCEDDMGGSNGDVNGEGGNDSNAAKIPDKNLINMIYLDNLSWKWTWNTEGNELKAYLNMCLVLVPYFAVNWVMGVVAIENATHWSTPTIYLILVITMYVYMTATICTTLPIIRAKPACCEEVVTETPQVVNARNTDSIPLLDPTIQQPNVTPAPADTISTISI